MKDIKKDVIGQSENALQQKCYFWFHNTYPEYRGLLFAVPNGGKRTKREAKTLKLTGVYSGVSDMIFLFNSKCYLLELKRDLSFAVLSEKQKKWKQLVEKNGFDYLVIRNLESFRFEINSIINKRK